MGIPLRGGINDNGQILIQGTSLNSNAALSVLRQPDGTTASIAASPGSPDFVVYGLNNAAQMVGTQQVYRAVHPPVLRATNGDVHCYTSVCDSDSAMLPRQLILSNIVVRETAVSGRGRPIVVEPYRDRKSTRL